MVAVVLYTYRRAVLDARARTERWHCTRLVAGRAGTAPLATTIEVRQRFVRIVSSDICFIEKVIFLILSRFIFF